MTVRYYLMPLIITEVPSGTDTRIVRGPKYLKCPANPTGLAVDFSAMVYGLIDVCLVRVDVTTQQHNGLAANADVTAIPANIDGNVTTQALSAVRAALEGLRIPGNWVTTAYTYRQILRMVAGLFQFAQRHKGLHSQIIIPEVVNLDQTWGDLPLEWRQNLQATADSFGYDYSQVTSSTPIRTILKSLADQWGSTPFLIGGVEL